MVIIVFSVFSVCLKYDIKQIPRYKKYSNFASQGDEMMHDFVLLSLIFLNFQE